MTPLLMFGVMIGSLFVVTRLRDSAWGVLALFGFTFIAGLMLTPILTVAAGFRNGGQLVALSGGLTAAVFFALAAYASVTKRDFAFLGKFLFVGLVLLIAASLANIFLQIPALVGDDLGGRGADLLALPAARPHQHRARRRDELRDGDAESVPQRVQHLHQPAEPAPRSSRGSATEAARSSCSHRGDASRPDFLCASRTSCASKRPSLRRLQRAKSAIDSTCACAETC